MALAEACLAAGQRDEARDLAEASAAAARTLGARGRLAWSLRLLGEIEARATGPERQAAAEGHLRDALALAGQLGVRPLAAHCDVGLGHRRAAAGDRPRAEADLATAVEPYREMGMASFLDAAERTRTSL